MSSNTESYQTSPSSLCLSTLSPSRLFLSLSLSLRWFGFLARSGSELNAHLFNFHPGVLGQAAKQRVHIADEIWDYGSERNEREEEEEEEEVVSGVPSLLLGLNFSPAVLPSRVISRASAPARREREGGEREGRRGEREGGGGGGGGAWEGRGGEWVERAGVRGGWESYERKGSHSFAFLFPLVTLLLSTH